MCPGVERSAPRLPILVGRVPANGPDAMFTAYLWQMEQNMSCIVLNFLNLHLFEMQVSLGSKFASSYFGLINRLTSGSSVAALKVKMKSLPVKASEKNF
jgi:hypothetical protein